MTLGLPRVFIGRDKISKGILHFSEEIIIHLRLFFNLE